MKKEMSHSEFVDYVRSFGSLFSSEIETLERYEEEEVLSFRFCIAYERLLEDRLRYCKTCSEHLRSMAARSFWFMKPRVLRRAMLFESKHNDALGRLMQVRLYKKVMYGEVKGFTD